MANKQPHSHDFFVHALQQAALSCIHLLQPPPAGHFGSSQAHNCPELSLPSCGISPPSAPQPAHHSFALPLHDDLDDLRSAQPQPHDASWSEYSQIIQLADFDSLDSFPSSGDGDAGYGLVPDPTAIEDFDSTSEKLDFDVQYGALEAEGFGTTPEKFEPIRSTSTSAFSFYSDAGECGREIETAFRARAQSVARDNSCNSMPSIDGDLWVQPITSSTCVSPARKKQRLSDPSEPVCVIVTKSDDDILDDGYRWRKYGQKSVKNSIYPRSYYRCSNAGGCKVLKQIQRSPVDDSLVWTTYKGRHAHGCSPFLRTY